MLLLFVAKLNKNVEVDLKIEKNNMIMISITYIWEIEKASLNFTKSTMLTKWHRDWICHFYLFFVCAISSIIFFLSKEFWICELWL